MKGSGSGWRSNSCCWRHLRKARLQGESQKEARQTMGRSLPGRAQTRQRESAKSTEPQIPVCVYSTGQRTTACRPGSALCLFSCGLQGKSGFYTSFYFNFFFFWIWPYHMAHRILVPWPSDQTHTPCFGSMEHVLEACIGTTGPPGECSHF